MLQSESLRRINVFKALEEDCLLELSSFCMVREVRKGETLFLETEPSPYCFGVLSGEVLLQKTFPATKSTPCIIRSLSAGSFFGESALLEQQKRGLMATVAKDGQLLIIPGLQLREWVYRNSEKGVSLVVSFLQETYASLEQTLHELSKSVR